AVESFLKGIYEKHSRVRVIMSGAGTSAFIGDALAPELAKQHKGNVTFDAVATTDIVSNPESYFVRDMPTILVSFARSGNGPERVAAATLGEKIVDASYKVVMTGNKDGQLAEIIKGVERSLTNVTQE